MPVLVNFKICDNAPECNGAAACKTGALMWDAKTKSLKIDNTKCVSCGACAPVCMVGAIKVAKTDAEYKKLKKEVDADTRKVSDLFVDRYGAQPLHEAFVLDEGRFDVGVLKYPRLIAVELFNEASIVCLYCSIPVKDLFSNKELCYRKVAVSGDALLKKFGVNSLPALLFFNNGKLIGKIEGHFTPEHAEELKQKITALVK